jgi:hypothetical protein
MDPDYIYATASQLGIKDPNRVSILENVITRLQQAERENLPSSAPTSSLDPKGEAGSKKSPMWLLPHHVKQAASWVLGLGARKYGPWNWRKTRVCASTYLSAIQRHLGAWEEREDMDPESGQNHLAHIIANCAILMDAQKHQCLEDDRP